MNNNEQIKRWIEHIFKFDFQGKKILKNQILNSKISYHQYYDYISIEFSVDEGIEIYPYKSRVPVEVIAYQKSSVPVLFLLHVVNGKISELEILKADSSEINPNNIELDNLKLLI